MGKRVRHHVNPLRAEFLGRRIDPIALPPVDVEVELGCADARFLFERAPHHPRTTFIGLEIREPLVDEVNEKGARARPREPARGVHQRQRRARRAVRRPAGRALLRQLPRSWFKRRHHKRRVMNPGAGWTSCTGSCAPGRELFFQSDVWDLALDALAVLEGAPQLFRNLDGPWSFCRDNPFGARSLREVRCEERQMRIWRMRYVRV